MTSEATLADLDEGLHEIGVELAIGYAMFVMSLLSVGLQYR
ncbi:MAG: hypothetical protein QOI71_2610 [Gaiellales bacterium]|jgi:hypothetical protein|nr:hypothetical protein [Gaiellales bacterium]